MSLLSKTDFMESKLAVSVSGPGKNVLSSSRTKVGNFLLILSEHSSNSPCGLNSDSYLSPLIEY